MFEFPIDLYHSIINKIESLENLIIQKEKPFLSFHEACEYLNVPANTLYAYTSKKIIPYYKLQNRRLYFSIDDLNNFILDKRNRYKSNSESEVESSSRHILEGRGHK